MTERERLKDLANEILSEAKASNYDLAFKVASNSPVLVSRLLGVQPELPATIAKDFVLGSCLLFANKPTDYQVPFYRSLEKLVSGSIQWPRQSGKTQSFGVGANLVALTRKNAQVLVISASMRQSMILRRKMNKPFNQMHKSLKNLLYDDILKTSVTTKSGSLIAFESCQSEDNIRGYSADLIIGDEVAMWPNADYLYNDVLDPMFNTTNGAFLAGSTPKTKAGFFYQLCTRSDFIHLKATIHDAFKAGITTAKRYNEALEKYRTGKLGEATWQTEYMAEFYDDVGKLLAYDQLVKCISKDAKYVYYKDPLQLKDVAGFTQIVGNFFTGTDLGQIGDNAVVKLFEKVNNYYCLRHCKVFDLGTPYTDLIKYHEDLAQVFTIRGGMVDGTNNAYLAEEINRKTSGEVVKLTPAFRKETARMLSERVTQNDLVLAPDMQDYLYALNSINRENLDTDPGEHSGNSDQFWATALAIRASLEHQHGVIARAGSR